MRRRYGRWAPATSRPGSNRAPPVVGDPPPSIPLTGGGRGRVGALPSAQPIALRRCLWDLGVPAVITGVSTLAVRQRRLEPAERRPRQGTTPTHARGVTSQHQSAAGSSWRARSRRRPLGIASVRPEPARRANHASLLPSRCERVPGPSTYARSGRPPVVTDHDIGAAAFASGSERDPIVRRCARSSSFPSIS
jgi:hypothetical protein